MRYLFLTLLAILLIFSTAFAEEMHVPLAIVPENDAGVICDDWLGDLPPASAWSLERIDGEDLGARIDGNSFTIANPPTQEGEIHYQAVGDEQVIDLFFDVVMPESLPEAVMAKDSSGNDLESLNLLTGETADVYGFFSPEDWQFRDYPLNLILWVDSASVEAYDVRFSSEGSHGTVQFLTPGTYRIGMKIGKANIVGYKFFEVTVEREKNGELERASSAGFDLTNGAGSISYRQFYALLDHVVELVSPERLGEWRQLNGEARNAANPVNRASAMVAMFNLAEFLGPDYFCFNNWEGINWENPAWETGQWNTDPYWGDTQRFAVGFNGNTEDDGSNYGGNAYFYSMGRFSLVNGKPLFESQDGNMRCDALLSDEEAVLAALRLYESGLASSERAPMEIDREILNLAEQRKQEILNAPTAVFAKGTKYYVSVSGDDKNSGLSPDDPWRTLEKVSKSKFKSGDTVFFKRGDTWRGESLMLRAGVTYSAYGEGAKPAFYGSPENAASPEKWHLLDGTDNIWVYDQEVIECGNIVFNEEFSAFRVAPYLEKGKYTMPDGSGEAFDVRKALTGDLMFYSEDDAFVRKMDVYRKNRNKGKLYLRCDQGNPGEVFSSIELCLWVNIKSTNKGVIYTDNTPFRDMAVVDNIAVKYTGVYGLNLGGSSVTVQNCEVGWIGGCSTDYYDYNDLVRFGNCVGNYGSIDGYRVLNCYLYQAMDSGISNEGNVKTVKHHKNIVYSGNLIENCVYGIEMFIENNNPDVEARMEDITIANNMILNTGFGFGSDRQYRGWDTHGAIMMHDYYNNLYHVVAIQNTFYRSKTYLVCNLIKSQKDKALFSGNTYVQDNLGALCGWAVEEDGTDVNKDYLFDENAAATVRDIIRDESATVAELSMRENDRTLRYSVAVMPQGLIERGILNNDWLFSMPYADDWELTLVEGEDLEAHVTDGGFWIDKNPQEAGTTIYRASRNGSVYDVILEKVVPVTLPEEAVLLNGNGEDILDQNVTLKTGEKMDVSCHFVPDDWTFQGEEQVISIWMENGEGEMETECDGTKGTLTLHTPGEYRIGVMVTSGNAVAYRFFYLRVEES